MASIPAPIAQAVAFYGQKSLEPSKEPAEVRMVEMPDDGLFVIADIPGALGPSVDGSTSLISTLPDIRPQDRKIPQSEEAVRKYFAELKAGDKQFQAFLSEALIALCESKPAGLQAVKFLGEWMLKNNPSQPRVETPEDWVQ